MTYEIIEIPRDDESIRAHIERYKAFRLLSLKTAPQAFGSTYEKEVTHPENVWFERLADPRMTTYIALQGDRIVCTLSAMGPLPCTPEESTPAKDPWTLLSSDPVVTKQLHYRLIRMFTLPEARGQGVAKALIQRFFKDGQEIAKEAGKDLVCSIVVDADNPAAKTLYEKCGFVTLLEEPYLPGSSRVVALMKYTSKADKKV